MFLPTVSKRGFWLSALIGVKARASCAYILHKHRNKLFNKILSQVRRFDNRFLEMTCPRDTTHNKLLIVTKYMKIIFVMSKDKHLYRVYYTDENDKIKICQMISEMTCDEFSTAGRYKDQTYYCNAIVRTADLYYVNVNLKMYDDESLANLVINDLPMTQLDILARKERDHKYIDVNTKDNHLIRAEYYEANDKDEIYKIIKKISVHILYSGCAKCTRLT